MAPVRPRFALSCALLGGAAAFAVLLLAVSGGGKPAASADGPGGFTTEVTLDALPWSTDFAFAPDGRIFIAGKDGVVRIVEDGSLLGTPFITLTTNTVGSRGLSGLALDPDFDTNGYVYLYYTYENNPDELLAPKTGRLIRVTADGNEALPGSETVILGSVTGDPGSPSCEDFPAGADCIPADGLDHFAGAMRFAADGTLYLSTGDGAFYVEGGELLALRSQDLDSLAGKVLRINPDGTAPSDNPFFTGDATANRSKVWVYGLRNPFRMDLQPGTQLPFIGDVGSGFWEEVNLGEPGANFGWPCYEGTATHPELDALQFCQDFYASGATTAHPLYTYPIPYLVGAAVIGGVFYQGTNYPSDFQDAFFFGDWLHQRISVLKVDENNELIPESVQQLLSDTSPPVDFELGPDGDIYYLTLDPEAGISQLRRVGFVAGNRPPIARASAAPAGGLGPLTVAFSSTGSADPDGDPLAYAWDFGDGSASTGANPKHTFIQDATYSVTLTVTDSGNATAGAAVSVVAGNQPPRATIAAPLSRVIQQSGDTVTFSGSGIDAEDGNVNPLRLQWEVLLHHCRPGGGCHTHPFMSAAGTGSSFVAPLDDEDVLYFELRLTASDTAGLTGTASLTLGPDSDDDGLLDFEEELLLGTDPLDQDSDNDGTHDGAEDADGDFISNINELNGVTSPRPELGVIITSPVDPDTDGDGCTDGQEHGTDPRLGGVRNPTDPWDFFDVAGPFLGPPDGRIDLANDIVGVVLKYQQRSTYASTLLGDHAAGATALTLLDAAALNPPQGKVYDADVIVLDPGGPNEELVEVGSSSGDTLTLTSPAGLAHAHGETVRAYIESYDRGGLKPGGRPWDLRPADLRIDLANDAVAIAYQYQHDCRLM